MQDFQPWEDLSKVHKGLVLFVRAVALRHVHADVPDYAHVLLSQNSTLSTKLGKTLFHRKDNNVVVEVDEQACVSSSKGCVATNKLCASPAIDVQKDWSLECLCEAEF